MIFLGEISNAQTGIFIGRSGKKLFGYHIGSFRELNEERKYESFDSISFDLG